MMRKAIGVWDMYNHSMTELKTAFLMGIANRRGWRGVKWYDLQERISVICTLIVDDKYTAHLLAYTLACGRHASYVLTTIECLLA